jgi:hypothetical protein
MENTKTATQFVTETVKVIAIGVRAGNVDKKSGKFLAEDLINRYVPHGANVWEIINQAGSDLKFLGISEYKIIF